MTACNIVKYNTITFGVSGGFGGEVSEAAPHLKIL